MTKDASHTEEDYEREFQEARKQTFTGRVEELSKALDLLFEEILAEWSSGPKFVVSLLRRCWRSFTGQKPRKDPWASKWAE